VRNNKPVVSHHTGETHNQWWANCPKCGALVYSTCSPSMIKEVLEVERSYCQHCGLKLDVSKIDTNEEHYNCSC
jgi:transcription elongation factor Elf1